MLSSTNKWKEVDPKAIAIEKKEMLAPMQYTDT